MVEVLTSVALLGVALSLGVSRIDSSVWRVDSAAAEVSTRARSARALAVLRQHNVRVTFDVDEGRIVIHEDANSDGAVGQYERVFGYRLDDQVELSRGLAAPYAGFASGPVTFINNTVTFLRNGSASEEGAVYVASANGLKVRAVVIARPTGYTDVIRFDGSGWIVDE